MQSWEDFWRQYCREDDRVYMKRAHSWGNQVEDVAEPHMDVYHPCVLPWSTMHITAMGVIALCPMDYDGKYNLGNVYENSIAEIWRNDKWKEIRRLHSSGNRNEMKICQGCRVFDYDFKLEKSQQKELADS
jgi:radical SAM protein with 4Fe4S-binding SPASM domain